MVWYCWPWHDTPRLHSFTFISLFSYLWNNQIRKDGLVNRPQCETEPKPSSSSTYYLCDICHDNFVCILVKTPNLTFGVSSWLNRDYRYFIVNVEMGLEQYFHFWVHNLLEYSVDLLFIRRTFLFDNSLMIDWLLIWSDITSITWVRNVRRSTLYVLYDATTSALQ